MTRHVGSVSLLAIMAGIVVAAAGAAQAQTVLFTSNFNGLTGATTSSTQVVTNFSVSANGGYSTWTKSGSGAINAVEVNGDWLPGFYEGGVDNVISATIAGANTSGQTYRVTFEIAPDTYNTTAQETGATDGILATMSNSTTGATLNSGTYDPGTFASQAGPSFLPFQSVTLNYLGTGSANATLSFTGSPSGNNHFGGTMDYVIVQETVLWTGGFSSNWGDGANWSGGVAPASGDVVLIGGSGGTISNNISNLQTGGIEFESGAGAYVVTGTGVTLAGNLNNLSASTQTVNLNMVLSGIYCQSNVTAGSNLIVGGIISDAGNGLPFTKIGAGTLTLSNANTYSGVTSIYGGVLSVNTMALGGSPSGIGQSSSAAPNLILNGGTLQYIGSGATTDHLFTLEPGGGTLDASGTGPIVWSNTGSLVGNGYALTLTGTNTGANTLTPTLTGASSLTKSGAGTWVLAGANTYSGTTTISSGILRLGNGTTDGSIGGNIVNNSSLVFATQASPTYAGVISGSGAISEVGPGTLTLTGSSTYVGNSTINSGTLAVTGTGRLYTGGNNTTAVITVNSGAILEVDRWDGGQVSPNYPSPDPVLFGTGSFGDLFFNNNQIVINGGTILYTGGTNFHGANLDGRGFTIGASGATLDAATTGQTWYINLDNRSTAYGIASNSGGLLTLTGAGNGEIDKVIPGTGGVTVSGPGTWTFTATNTYSGATAITGGTLQIGNGGSTGTLGTNSGAIADGGTLALNLSGSITVPNVISGAGSFAQSGGGTTWLSGASSYSGATTITAGALVLSSTASLGNTAISVSSGATFSPQPGTGIITAGSTNVVGKGASLNLAAGTIFAMTDGAIGTFQLQQESTFPGPALTLAGATLNFDLTGAGPDLLAAGGKASVSGTNVINFTTSGASLTTGGPFNFITASSGLTGTFQFSNGSTTETAVVGGTSYSLTLGNSATAESLFISSGPATLTWTGQTNGNGGPASTWDIGTTNNWASVADTAATYNPDGDIVYFTDINPVTGSAVSNGTINIQSAGVAPSQVVFTDTSVSYVISATSGPIQGSASLSVSGSGMLTILNSNTYSGGTTVSAGTLRVGASTSVASGAITGGPVGTGTLTLSGGTLQDNGSSITLANNIAITANTTFSSSSTGSLILDGTNRTSPATVALSNSPTLTVSNTTTINDVISGVGQSLTVTGSGTLTLNGANTYNGVTTINGIVLSVGTMALGGAASSVGESGSAAANLVLNGGTLQYTGSGATTDRLFTLGATGGTLDASGTGPIVWSNTGALASNGFALTLTGANTGANTLTPALTGAGTLTKTGPGTWVLAGTNTYTGNTTINEGTLAVTGTGLLYAGGNNTTSVITVNSGGTLEVDRWDGGQVAPNYPSPDPTLFGTGSFGYLFFNNNQIVINGGTILYTGNTNFHGANNIDGRGFTIGAMGATLDAATAGQTWYINQDNRSTAYGIASNSGGLLTLAGAGNGEIDKVLPGTGGVTVSGPGTWTLTAANTYGGTTTINGGTLRIGNGGATGTLGTGAVTNDAALVFNLADPTTVANAISGSGTLTQSGTGTTTLTGANSYIGATTVTAGTLAVSGTGTLSGTTSLSVAGGAAFNYLPAAAGPFALGSGSLSLSNNSTVGLAFGSSITSSGPATVNGNVYLNISGTPTANTQYTLLTAGSGLTSNNPTYLIYNTNYNYSLSSSTDAALILTTGTVIGALANEYWIGGLSGNATSWAASNGSTASNWASDASGTATPLLPGSTAVVNFSATGATNQGSMVLGANISIAGIVVNDTTPISLNADGNTLTIGSSGITVNNTNGNPNVTIGSLVALGAPQTWTNNSGTALTVSGSTVSNGGNLLTIAGSGNTTISSAIAGAGGLAVATTGSGTVTLSGANSFTGGLTIANGTASVATWNNKNTNGPLGNTPSQITLGAATTGGGSGTIIYTGAEQANDNNSIGLNIAPGGGTINVEATGTAPAYLEIGSTAAGGGTGGIAGSGPLTVTTTPGVRFITVSGSNSFSGPVTISANSNFQTNAAGAVTETPFGAGSNGLGPTITMNAGSILDVFNPSNTTIPIGSLNSTSNTSTVRIETGGILTLDIGGDNTNASYAGVIIPNSGTLLVVIQGSGSQTFSGANTYNGGTTINSGTLRAANGASSSATGTGTVKVNSTGTLAGSLSPSQGFITGAVTVNSGGTISASNGNTLTLSGGLTLASGAASAFNLAGSSSANAQIATSIGSGNSLVVSGDTIALTNVPAGGGTYDLFSFTGAAPMASSFTLPSAPAGSYYLLNVTSSQVDLTVTNTLTWTGNNGTSWDASTPNNWAANSTAETYTDGSNVVFNDTNATSGPAPGGTVVVQSGGVAPASVRFNNTNTPVTGVAYTIDSTGSANGITGGTGITLAENGTVTLLGPNTYTGATMLNAGTLVIRNVNSIGSATAPLTFNGGTLRYASASNPAVTDISADRTVTIGSNGATVDINGNNVIFANPIGNNGGGGLTLINSASPGTPATLTLAAANTYGGGTNVNSGTLRVSNTNPTSSATGSGAVHINNTSTLTGAGFIIGSVTAAPSATIAPSLAGTSFEGTISQLSVGGLTLGNGTQLNYQVNSFVSMDSIAVTNSGTLTLPSSGAALFNFYAPGTGSTPYTFGLGTYSLISYGSLVLTGTLGSSLSIGAGNNTWPANDTAAFTTTTSSGPGTLELVISASVSSGKWISSSSTDFGNSGNWDSEQVPNGAGLSATFGTGTQMTVSVNGAYTVGQLNFNNSISGASYFLTGSGSLTLNNTGGGASVNVSSVGLSPSILTTLTLADSSLTTTFNVASDGSLDLAGTINESTPTGQKIVLTGGGIVTMDNGTNSYTGGTTVNGGTTVIVDSPSGDSALGSGPLAINGSSSNVTITTSPLTVGSLSGTGAGQLNVGGSTTLTVNETTSSTFSGTLTLDGGLVLASASGNTLTISGAPTLNDGSSISVNSGTLAFTNSMAATINGSPTVSVASGATLQLAGSAAALSSAVNITTHGSGSASDGALTLVGNTTQTVGIVSGDTLSGTVTAYSGNTTVGDGTNVANLTATQILQNTLTINAGSTVTIAPSGSGIETDAQGTVSGVALAAGSSNSNSASADSSDPFTAIQAAIASGSISSVKGQQLENRIAAIERLAATDPGLDVSLLEDRVLAAIPSSSIWSSTSSAPLAETGSSLLAVDGSSIASASGSVFSPSGSIGGSLAAVPEPSTLLLAALGGIGILVAVRRRTIYCE